MHLQDDASLKRCCSLGRRIFSLVIEQQGAFYLSNWLKCTLYLPELHRTTEFLVLDQQQFPAQRLVSLSRLPESRDIVRHRFHAGRIHNRFAHQALPHELRVASPLLWQHRLGGDSARKPANRRVSSATRWGPGRVRLARMPSDFERWLSAPIVDVNAKLVKWRVA